MTASTTPEQATESNATARQPNYQRMFQAACVALGEIGDALGCDPNEGGAEPILDAIEALIAERDALKSNADRYQWLRKQTRGHRGACFDQMWFLLPDVKRLPDQNIMQGSIAQHLDTAIDATMKAVNHE
jgi:hypothetical protein